MVRRLMTDVRDELQHEDFDADEPMMAGSDDEFNDIEDVYLEDVEDDINSAAAPHLPPSDTPSSSSNSPPPLLVPQASHHPSIYLASGAYG